MKWFFVVISMVLIGVVVWVGLGINDAAQQSSTDLSQVASQDSEFSASPDPNILIIGNPDAKVSIFEYADFKCPECGKYHQGAGKKIRQEYVNTGKVKIIFRPYPVFAEDGAKLLAASYCAQEQGKFTTYHDTFFEYMWTEHFQYGNYQKAIDPVLIGDTLDQLFRKIGIDKTAYDACFVSEKYKAAYDADLWVSGDDEVQGTPTFIINGQKVVGPQDYSVFKTLLDIALTK